MVRVQFAVMMAALALLVGCAAGPALRGGPALDPQTLLATPALYDPSREAEVPATASILELDEGMRQFVQRHVTRRAPPGRRLQQLLQGMIDEGYLTLDYESGTTLTARQTFKRRIGNCLSFTNLFVALGRQAGLDVRYQIVEVPPRWEVHDNWVVLDNHINTVLHNIKVNSVRRQDYVIDFNVADYQGNYPRAEVEDADAFALYYNNLGVEALRRDDHGLAFANLRRAAVLNPRLSAAWANLGALFRAANLTREAESANRQALRIDPRNPTALANLAQLLRDTGRVEAAERVEARIVALRNQNPYYFYQRGLDAYRHGDWALAGAQLDRALRLKRTEHQFHYLQALLARQAGDFERTLTSLRQALKYAALPRVQDRYETELRALEQAGSFEAL